MSTIAFEALACPLDGDPLHRRDGAWCCEAGHGFDIARQGYVHLLPVQRKRSRDPGDSKEMVAARRRFLEAGHYQPIAQAVAQAVLKEAPADRALHCLDAGSGEGYYLRELEGAAGDDQKLALLGVDISKWAVLAAAKSQKAATWVVGTNAQLPVQTCSLERVLCMFGFPVYTEFARVLKPGGELLQVDAGADHLRELREVIYPTIKSPRNEDNSVPEGFTRTSCERLSYTIDLAHAAQIADLLAMTPHLHRANAEGRARAAALESLTVSVDVQITRFTCQ
ncbi:putative RNA methyltransferase [Halomonas binhaiensis]|uniref:Methyltransferase domain-containing protein n=1 Tax=Halomonas binhaiensis TaxID=2562282 RepID=A0A5C1NJQ4_9GAMM|nr:methyltransferase domain-containing protein [Halomonas binhaiensis]QEM83020.1 methyltransferase domain-containing protein [Halomonas binhaiensis]